MRSKFRNFFIIAGSIALVALIIQVIVTFPDFDPAYILLNALPALLLYFMAYKTYHENHNNGPAEVKAEPADIKK